MDGWVWKAKEGGVLSVKSSYKKLEKLLVSEEGRSLQKKKVFEAIWKSPTPTKVVAFSWQLLHNRIPTRLNLARRNALPLESSTTCVLCGRGEESSSHLFLHC